MTTENEKQKTAQAIFIVRNDKGLHTRPCTEIVKCMVKFKCSVMLYHQKSEVNAKSLLGILMLAATKGSKITVKAMGEDASEAVAALLELSKKDFNMHY